MKLDNLIPFICDIVKDIIELKNNINSLKNSDI